MPKKSDYLIDRRQFVGGVVGIVGAIMSAAVGLPIVGYLISPALKKPGGREWIPLGTASALEPGVPALFTFSQLRQVGWKRTKINYAVYAIADDTGNVTVFSDDCTHLSCKVHWEPERGAFICPCHDGVFDREGDVVAGPPPRPLDRFEATVQDGQLMIWVEA